MKKLILSFMMIFLISDLSFAYDDDDDRSSRRSRRGG